ncbi:MAG: tetratricopeptide repeat protein [Myxococcales bacterium]|nr:tetratricopeptide repeat protein [Myxococcales bacterium]
MSIDRQKVLDSAQKFAAKGQFDKAIAEYQRLVKEDPSDVRILLKIGDLQFRRGAREDAVATYSKVARGYEEQGFALKAIAVYKQILSIDPNLTDLHGKLAELYVQLGLVPDALVNLEALAARYARAGTDDKLVGVVRQMVQIDPSNVAMRIKLAELLSKLGKNVDAATEFEKGGELLLKANRVDDWARVTERLLFHRPEDAKVARDLAKHYLERKDAKRALPKLQVVFKANPRDITVLEMLAESFVALGQGPKAVSVLKEIARLLLEKNELERRVTICERILQIAPDDHDAKAALDATKKAIDAAKAPVVSDEPDIAVEDEVEEEVVVVDDEPEAPIPLEKPSAKPAPQPQRRPTPQPQPRVAPQPVAQAQPTPATAPRRNTPQPSVIQPSVASQQPTRPKSQPRIQAVQAPTTPALVATEQGRLVAEQLIAQEQMHPDVARLVGEVEIFQKYNLRTKAIAHLSRALEIDPRALGVHSRLRDVLEGHGDRVAAARHGAYVAAVLAAQDLDAATWAVLRAIELDPSNPEALDLYARIAEVAAMPDEDAPLDAAPQSPAEESIIDDEAIVEGADGDGLAPDIEAGLDEVEFYVSQGMYREALENLKILVSAHPTHPLVAERWEEVQALAQAQGGEDESFALAEKLAEEVQVQGAGDAHFAGADQMIDVETVFAQFKQGVAKVVSADDADTHYDLGIAYKEMGLTDDAMNEFIVAAQAPRKQCLAQTMVGMCLMEKGDPGAAIPWFEQALSAPLRSDREEMGLFYELGNAYELTGNGAQAIEYFRMAERRDAKFRDVQERIARLARGGAAPSNVPEMDDVDRAFEELMKG